MKLMIYKDYKKKIKSHNTIVSIIRGGLILLIWFLTLLLLPVGNNYKLCFQFWPGGFYNVLKMLREEYDNPPIFVTESGFTSSNTLDGDRIKKFKAYMSALLDAVDSGSDIRAYTFWTLMDNFEWAAGYE